MNFSTTHKLLAACAAIAVGLGSLAGCANFDDIQAKATASRLETVSHHIRVYVSETGVAPDDLAEMVTPPHYVQPLLVNRQMLDGWGQPIDYTTDGLTFSLTSAGADGDFGTADDITRRGAAIAPPALPPIPASEGPPAA